MPPKELVDEIKKAYDEYKKEKGKEVDYLTFYNGFVACNRNRQKENRERLEQAKKIIKGWLGDFYNPKAFYDKRAELVEQSEQFLKEIEK